MDEKAFATAVRQHLAAGRAVRTEIGLFFAHRRAEVHGQNPVTRVSIVIPGATVVAFVPSGEFVRATFAGSVHDESEWLSYVCERLLRGAPIPQGPVALVAPEAATRLAAASAKGDPVAIPGLGELDVSGAERGVFNFRATEELTRALSDATSS